MGEVDLGLDFVRLSTGRPAGTAGNLGLAGGAEVSPHLLRFMILKGAGMALFLRDSNFRKHVENRLALDFQLSGQIVDPNLAHPPFPSRYCPLRLHINLTAQYKFWRTPRGMREQSVL